VNSWANTGSRLIHLPPHLSLSITKLDQIYQLFGPEAKNIKIWRYEPSGIWCCVAGPSSPLGIFRIWALWSFKTSINTHPMTQCHVPEALNLQQHHYVNLKSVILNYCCHFHILSWCYYERFLQVASAVYKRTVLNNTILSKIQLLHGVYSPLITFGSSEVTTLLLPYTCNGGSKYITYIYWPLKHTPCPQSHCIFHTNIFIGDI